MGNRVNEQLERQRQKYEECNHLFVKTREGVHYYGFHSSDCGYDPPVVVCLECGLTNKHIEMEYKEKRYFDILLWYRNPLRLKQLLINDEEFKKQFNHGYLRGGKSFDDSVFNLISSGALSSTHPGILYRLAKKIKPDATNEELFNTMKTLHDIETPSERIELESEEEIEGLLNRYKEVKIIKNEKK